MAKMSHSQLAKMFRRLATTYKAGIDLRSAFTKETELGSVSNRQSAKVVATEIAAGKSLGEALRSAGTDFPPLAISIVAAGERGGRLEQSLERLAHHYENLVKFRNALLISIAWPVFELCFAVSIIGLLILALGILVGDDAANWFGMGSYIANFLFYVFCVAIVVSCLVFGFFGVKLGWFGTAPMQLARRIPVLGSTIEAMALSRFAWALSIAENAGINALETTKMALSASENYYYTRLEEPVTSALRGGADFATAFRQTEAFPEEFLIFVENGEAAGELAESMDRASQDLQNRVENNMKLLGTIGFALTFMFVAVVIGATIIMMYQRLVFDRYSEFL